MESKSNELKNTSYELFIGALSLLSIINLVLFSFLSDPNVSAVISIMDGFLSLIFLTDFLYRLFTANSKSEYFFRQMGWADLLASIPAPQFKLLRVFRIIRVYRLMKVFGAKRMIKEFISNRGGSALLVLFFLMILILEFGGLAILWVESQIEGANITTASDAVWYVYVTITTVGYGDQYPVSNSGRILGVIIMTVGVGLFGTITAFLANIFVSPAEEEKVLEPETAVVDLAEMAAQVEEVKQLLLAYDQANANLFAKLEGIEDILQQYLPRSFFYKEIHLGSFREDQTLPDDLVNLAGCLNLVSNAVIVWNTVYMQAAIDELRRQGHAVNEDDFVHLSPVRFQHINRYGKFRFDLGDDLASSGLRPLRFG